MHVQIAGFQQYEQTMTTPCQGGDPNKYLNEKDIDYYQKVLFCRPNHNGFKHL